LSRIQCMADSALVPARVGSAPPAATTSWIGQLQGLKTATSSPARTLPQLARLLPKDDMNAPHQPPLEPYLDYAMISLHRDQLREVHKTEGWPGIRRLAARKSAPISPDAQVMIQRLDANLAGKARAADHADNERRHRETQNMAWAAAMIAVLSLLVSVVALFKP
jgi:hypothetical protein